MQICSIITDLQVLVWKSISWDDSTTTFSLNDNFHNAVLNFKQSVVNLTAGLFDKVFAKALLQP